MDEDFSKLTLKEKMAKATKDTEPKYFWSMDDSAMYHDLENEIHRLEKNLGIATKALEDVKRNPACNSILYSIAVVAISSIERK